MTKEEIKEIANQKFENKFHFIDEISAYGDGFLDGYNYGFKSPWIDVSDHLPDYLKEVLIFNGYITQIGFFGKKEVYSISKHEIYGARYWMEIPETPKHDNKPILNLP